MKLLLLIFLLVGLFIDFIYFIGAIVCLEFMIIRWLIKWGWNDNNVKVRRRRHV